MADEEPQLRTERLIGMAVRLHCLVYGGVGCESMTGVEQRVAIAELVAELEFEDLVAYCPGAVAVVRVARRLLDSPAAGSGEVAAHDAPGQ
jgi:hypothetical protein